MAITTAKLNNLIKEFKAFPQTVKIYDEEARMYDRTEIRTFERVQDDEGIYAYYEDGDLTDEGHPMEFVTWRAFDLAEIWTRDGRLMHSEAAPEMIEE